MKCCIDIFLLLGGTACFALEGCTDRGALSMAQPHRSDAPGSVRSAVRQSQAQSEIAPAPANVVHIGFADPNTGELMTNAAWTNQWDWAAWTGPDLNAPTNQWQRFKPALEMYHGVLAFQLTNTGGQGFCRLEFISKP